MIVDLDKRWMKEDTMACLTTDPELFFVDMGATTVKNPGIKIQGQWDRAKAICSTCPVMQQCARDNLGEYEGVWGGLDPAQRAVIRKQHERNVRRLEGGLKVEYAKLAYDLRVGQKYAYSDIGRVMGLPASGAQYLHEWYKAYLEEQPEAAPVVVDLELPEQPLAKVLEIRLEFPANPPASGADAWVKYGRSVVAGHYLGQTEDDAWYRFKLKLIGPDYSVCWIKAEDVRMCREVARNVLTRVGNESRIYGTAKGTHSGRTAEVG